MISKPDTNGAAYDLCVFCGYGNETVKFLSNRRLLLADGQIVPTETENALTALGMRNIEIRRALFSLLDGTRSFAEGFRFENKVDGRELRVYVTQYNPQLERQIAAGLKGPEPAGLPQALRLLELSRQKREAAQKAPNLRRTDA